MNNMTSKVAVQATGETIGHCDMFLLDYKIPRTCGSETGRDVYLNLNTQVEEAIAAVFTEYGVAEEKFDIHSTSMPSPSCGAKCLKYAPAWRVKFSCIKEDYSKIHGSIYLAFINIIDSWVDCYSTGMLIEILKREIRTEFLV